MTQKEAIIELLTPYYNGDEPFSTIGAGENLECVYRGNKGSMCVFAKACTPKGRALLVEGTSGASNIINIGAPQLLQKKYLKLFKHSQWDIIQDVHDSFFNEASLDSLCRNFPFMKGIFKPL